MTKGQGILLLLGAAAGASALSYYITRQAVISRCRVVYKRECMKVPLLTDAYCEERAEEVCSA